MSDTVTSTSTSILLVEDNPGDLRLFEELLGDAVKRGMDPVELHHVDRITHALQWLQTHPRPLAVFTDLGLPDAWGLEAVDHLLTADPSLTVIVATGNADQDLTARALQQGAQDWVVKTDTTDGSALARTLRHATARAQGRRELLRSRDDLRRFAHVVAHDLKAPLTMVAGALDMAVAHGTGDDPDLTQILDNARRAALRMAEMTDGLLTYADTIDPDEVDDVHLDEVVGWVMELLDHQVDDVGGTWEVDRALPIVRGNVAGLRQVLLNLVTNSIKYRSVDRPLRLQIRAAQTTDTHVRIQVSDNGIGIPPDQRHRVFDTGTRIHGDTGATGLGLGLSAVRDVIDRHGGTIRIHDGPDGTGTTVAITLHGHMTA